MKQNTTEINSALGFLYFKGNHYNSLKEKFLPFLLSMECLAVLYTKFIKPQTHKISSKRML